MIPGAPAREVPEDLRPHMNMWMGVILQAVIDYVVNRGRTGAHERRLFYNAQWWLFEDASERSNAFTTLCEMLDLDPDRVRRGAKDLTAAELRQLKLHNDRRRHAQVDRHHALEHWDSDRALKWDAENGSGAAEHTDTVCALAGGGPDLLVASR